VACVRFGNDAPIICAGGTKGCLTPSFREILRQPPYRLRIILASRFNLSLERAGDTKANNARHFAATLAVRYLFGESKRYPSISSNISARYRTSQMQLQYYVMRRSSFSMVVRSNSLRFPLNRFPRWMRGDQCAESCCSCFIYSLAYRYS